MRLHITHETTYHYSLPARLSVNELRLSPEDSPRQTPGETHFRIDPVATLASSRDLFGNLVHQFEFEDKHPSLNIAVESTVETRPYSPPSHEVLHSPLPHPSKHSGDDHLRDFLSESNCIPRDPETWREALDLQSCSDNTWAGFVLTLSQHIFENCKYCEQHIHTMRAASQVQRERTGTCQDFSHLLIAYLRLLHIPARYISGYLYDPGLDGGTSPELIGSGTTHAWVEAYLPNFGWLGIDPTNNCWVNENYVSLAFGRDYHDVVPIRGSFMGGGNNRELEVSILVQKLA